MDWLRAGFAKALGAISKRWLAAFCLWRADRNELASSWWLGLRRKVRNSQRK